MLDRIAYLHGKTAEKRPCVVLPDPYDLRLLFYSELINLISLNCLDDYVKIHWFTGFLSSDYVIYLTKHLIQASKLWGTVAFG